MTHICPICGGNRDAGKDAALVLLREIGELKPRADWHNPGEGEFIYRSPDKVHSQAAPIPRRKKK